MKKKIKLTEAQLIEYIQKTINKVLKEQREDLQRKQHYEKNNYN